MKPQPRVADLRGLVQFDLCNKLYSLIFSQARKVLYVTVSQRKYNFHCSYPFFSFLAVSLCRTKHLFQMEQEYFFVISTLSSLGNTHPKDVTTSRFQEHPGTCSFLFVKKLSLGLVEDMHSSLVGVDKWLVT